MKNVLRIFLIAAVGLIFVPNPASAEASFGLSVDDEGLKSFYLAVGDHYKVPEKEIVVVRERKVPDEQMPVVFFLARRADVAPSAVLSLRSDGKSWMDIALHFGLSAETFYVPVKSDPGPPYGHAYGHFKKHKRDKWQDIRLSDDDIVNFVNLRFVSDHYGWSTDDIIKMRQSGKNFVDINRDVKQKKKGGQKQAYADNDNPGKGNKGKGKKKK